MRSFRSSPTPTARRLRPLAALLALAPLPALAMIVIGNPVHGEAWSPSGASVDEMVAPIAGVRPHGCDGSTGNVVPYHVSYDLVGANGFPLPAGTWCGVELLLEGPVKVRVGGVTTFVDTTLIDLRENPPITGYKLVVHGDQGTLTGDVHGS